MFKRKLVVVCVTAAVLLSGFGCSSAPKEVSVDVSCDDFMSQSAISKDVKLAVDGSLTVTLCSNATTGFQWESPRISDPTVLEQVDHRFEPPETNVPGAAGKEIWTFKALEKGESTISIDYSRPWEGGEKGAWTFVLTAVVK